MFAQPNEAVLGRRVKIRGARQVTPAELFPPGLQKSLWITSAFSSFPCLLKA